jgi:hypothetical protein
LFENNDYFYFRENVTCLEIDELLLLLLFVEEVNIDVLPLIFKALIGIPSRANRAAPPAFGWGEGTGAGVSVRTGNETATGGRKI